MDRPVVLVVIAVMLLAGALEAADITIAPPAKRLPERAGFHMQPYALLDGILVRKGKASGYFSCDEKRVPLLVSVQAPLFTEIVGYLTKEE